MKSDRLVIFAAVFLAAGLGLIFGFTNGTTGMNVGYPFAESRLHVDITTTGLPALLGASGCGWRASAAVRVDRGCRIAVPARGTHPEPAPGVGYGLEAAGTVRRIRRIGRNKPEIRVLGAPS
jgi:hypothetical protein